MREFNSTVKGVVPFGYLPDKVTPHPAEAALLREAARSIIEENTSLDYWAKEFNRRGFRTRKGFPFLSDRLKALLKNPRYAGVVVHFGVQTDEPAPWAAIFDQHTWQALQARLSRPGIRPEMHPQAIYLGTSIARCGVCSRTMQGHLTPYEGPRYACDSKRDPGRTPDGLRHPQIKAEWLDESIVSGIFAVLHEHGTKATTTTNTIGGINARIGVLKAAKDSALGLVHDPDTGITVADVGMRLRGLENEISVLEAERDDVMLQTALDKIDAADIGTFARTWGSLSLPEQRRIARRMVVVTVYNGTGPSRVHVEALNAA